MKASKEPEMRRTKRAGSGVEEEMKEDCPMRMRRLETVLSAVRLRTLVSV